MAAYNGNVSTYKVNCCWALVGKRKSYRRVSYALVIPWATQRKVWHQMAVWTATQRWWLSKRPFCAILFFASPRVTKASETRQLPTTTWNRSITTGGCVLEFMLSNGSYIQNNPRAIATVAVGDLPDFVWSRTPVHVIILRQDPLEAILVNFGRRALILFLFESSWKKWKLTPLLCACAVVITLETQKCQKGHLATLNLTFLLIAIYTNDFRRMKEEGLIYKSCLRVSNFCPGT